MNAHVQRCIHLFIAMEEKDVICRLVNGFDLSFETLEGVLSLGSCADVGMLPGWGVWWRLSQSPGFPCSQGHGSCCQSAPHTESPPVGKEVSVAGLTSSPVSLAAWTVPGALILLLHASCSILSARVPLCMWK